MKFELEWFDEIPSTSTLLLSRAGQPNFHGTVISARRQTQGRGRHSRTWETGEGNLAFSVGFCLESGQPAPYLPICAGIAVFDGIAKYLDEEARQDLLLKWPNDLVWRRQKLMGQLTQARVVEGRTYLSIGIGINIAWAPRSLPAICLHEMPLVGTEKPSPDEVLEEILCRLSTYQAHWSDFAWVKKEWTKRAPYLNKQIYFGRLEAEEEMQLATALELDVSGSLRVRLEDGRETLLNTEDLSLRIN